MGKKNQKVFLDIKIGTRQAGRITIELFFDITPITAKNFKQLCTGESAHDYSLKFQEKAVKHRKLCYEGTQFHRIIDGFMVQGGDLSFQNDGSVSIPASKVNDAKDYFIDENFQRRHSQAGCLSMANKGPNTNGSQFFITLKESPHLDDKHVVFGQVTDGMDVVQQMARVPTDINDKPRIPVVITASGLLDQEQGKILDSDQLNNMSIANRLTEKLHPRINLFDSQNQQKDQNQTNFEQIDDELDPEMKKLLFDLDLQINEALAENNQAVAEEIQILSDPNYYRRLNKQKYFREKILGKRNISERINPIIEKNEGYRKYLNAETKTYFFESAISAEKQNEWQKKQKQEQFSWDVFNEDSLFRAYQKRARSIEKAEDMTQDEYKERLADEVEEMIEKRGNFSRRRMFVEEKDIDYINERNRKFNQKLERNYKQFADQIKFNLERGTAL